MLSRLLHGCSAIVSARKGHPNAIRRTSVSPDAPAHEPQPTPVPPRPRTPISALKKTAYAVQRARIGVLGHLTLQRTWPQKGSNCCQFFHGSCTRTLRYSRHTPYGKTKMQQLHQEIPHRSLEFIAQTLTNIECLAVVRNKGAEIDQVPPVLVADDAMIFCQWTQQRWRSDSGKTA